MCFPSWQARSADGSLELSILLRHPPYLLCPERAPLLAARDPVAALTAAAPGPEAPSAAADPDDFMAALLESISRFGTGSLDEEVCRD